MMGNGNWLSLIHTVFASAALVFGAAVLLLNKASKQHKILGYLYVISMTINLATAFCIYNLFGAWGIFHWAAVIGTFSLSLGFGAALFKKPGKNWLKYHHEYMLWSYTGLLAAAFSELGVRLPVIWPQIGDSLPIQYFWLATTVASGLVCLLGAFCIYKLKLWYPKHN